MVTSHATRLIGHSVLLSQQAQEFRQSVPDPFLTFEGGVWIRDYCIICILCLLYFMISNTHIAAFVSCFIVAKSKYCSLCILSFTGKIKSVPESSSMWQLYAEVCMFAGYCTCVSSSTNNNPFICDYPCSILQTPFLCADSPCRLGCSDMNSDVHRCRLMTGNSVDDPPEITV